MEDIVLFQVYPRSVFTVYFTKPEAARWLNARTRGSDVTLRKASPLISNRNKQKQKAQQLFSVFYQERYFAVNTQAA